jgi:WD40 repeat protein
LVKTCRKGKEEDNDFPYEIFHSGTQDLQQVNIPEIKQREHYPLLDKAGKYIVYSSADSITLLHLVSGNRITKLFKDITDDASKNQMVSMRMSTDTSHLVVLLDDGEILLIDTDSLMQVDRWTLKDEVEDVTGILCTKSDNLQVLVAVNRESEGKKTSELQLYKPGDLEPRCFLFHFPLVKHLHGLSKKENFFTAIAEDGNSSKILTIDINRAEEMAPIDVGETIKQVAFSKSKSFTCVLMDTGKVAAVDLEKSEIMFNMTTEKPVTYFGISGAYSLVMLGDSDGSITLWNFKTKKNCGKFPAHSGPVQNMKVLDDYLVSHGQNEMKVWSLTELLVDFQESLKKNVASAFSGIMAMKTVISFDVHPNGIELATASKDQMLRVWLLNGAKFLKEVDIGMEAKKTVICADDKCCLLDNKGELKVMNLNTTDDIDLDTPSHVSDFVVGKDGITLYTVGLKQKTLMVNIMDMKQGTTKKTFPLKGSLKFESLDLCLSASERYLCIRCKILPAEYKEIEASWKKKGSFLAQVHPYKFLAVDLQQATGGMMTCMRELSTIPHLGEEINAKAGNVMYITTRRWVVFWDIPTGREG